MRYNTFSASVSAAISEDINHLPTIKEEIATAYPNVLLGRQAAIGYVHLLSASSFTVRFNEIDNITSVLTVNGNYLVEYEGTITQLVFSASTTLLELQVGWFADRKNYNIPTFTMAAGTTVTIKDVYGNTIPACGTNQFELGVGNYTITATNSIYETLVETIYYHLETSITLRQTPVHWDITVSPTPETATVVVTDLGGTVIQPTEGNVYSLADSGVVGDYTIAVSAPGYTSSAQTYSATQDATVSVTLVAKVWDITVSPTPDTATVVVTDSDGDTVSPTGGVYKLTDFNVAGDYTITVSATGYVTDTQTYAATADATVEVTLTEE